MHDRKATYTIVYDAADPDLSDRDHTYGTTLLMADWLAIRNDPAMVGMSEPVLVEQFFANSWERAMQHWNDLRGYGTYYMRCQGNHPLEEHRQVLWVNDDHLCCACLILEKINEEIGPLVPHNVAVPIIKERCATLLAEFRRRGIIRNFTVSSEIAPKGDHFTVRAFYTDRLGREMHLGFYT